MEEPIENGIGDGRIADDVVPTVDWHLARNDHRPALVTVLDCYDSNAIRAMAAERKAWANIPPKANRKSTFAFSAWVYRQRNPVERFFNRIKHFRGIATRYDKNPANYLAAVKLVAPRIWCQPL